MASLSIGIPVFNGERFIESSIKSVLAQSLHDIEIIISDNASTDDTQRICLQFAAVDGRIKYFRQPSTMSPMDNFRFVVEAASGEFFGWQAHDDDMGPQFCQVARDYFLAHPAVVCVSGDFHVIDSVGTIIKDIQLTNIRDTLTWEERIRHFFHQSKTSKSYMCIYGLFRRTLLRDVLRQIRTGPILGHTEIPILSRLASMGEIASLPVVLRSYRVHADSASHTESRAESSSGWTGRLFSFYGRMWYKHDQLWVLLRSSLAWRLKLSILRTVLAYQLKRTASVVVGCCSRSTAG